MRGKNLPVWWKFTPWGIIRKRFLTEEHFQPEMFARRHGLDCVQMKRLHEGRQFSFWPALCQALSKETGMSVEFFENLSRYHHIMPPSTPMAATLPQGDPGQFL